MKTRKIEIETTKNGCYECISHAVNKAGYPCMTLKGKQFRLSRFIYEQKNGPIPDGKIVRHTCDNPKCINPYHLILGTQAENMNDKKERGRCVVGNSSKLSYEQALEIRNSVLTNNVLANTYNVTTRTIQKIRNGYTRVNA